MISVNKKIFNSKLFSKNYQLQNLLNERKNYQNKISIINVVGTNGKGSVTNYLSHGLILKYKEVGSFISPAFLYHNERIQINNIPISDKDLLLILKKNKFDIKKYKLTFFEIWVLVAIEYFTIKNIQYAVIEAGIGGKFDATNVFKNQQMVCLTSVSLDHTEVLGNTVEKIISQKIEIGNKDLLTITVDQNKLFLANYLNWNIKYTQSDFDYEIENKNIAKEVLKELNIDSKILEKVVLPLGRKIKLGNFILDGAHNLDGVKKLFTSIKLENKYKILYASSLEKNSEVILSYLNSLNQELYITEFKHIKSWKIPNHYNYLKVKSWKKFLRQNKNETIIILGSLYFIPIVYEFIRRKNNELIFTN